MITCMRFCSFVLGKLNKLFCQSFLFPWFLRWLDVFKMCGNVLSMYDLIICIGQHTTRRSEDGQMKRLHASYWWRLSTTIFFWYVCILKPSVHLQCGCFYLCFSGEQTCGSRIPAPSSRTAAATEFQRILPHKIVADWLTTCQAAAYVLSKT
jgi:hypothetical protein